MRKILVIKKEPFYDKSLNKKLKKKKKNLYNHMFTKMRRNFRF